MLGKGFCYRFTYSPASAGDQSNSFHAHPVNSAKKSFPLSSTTTNAGKSSTSIFQIASIPSSGYSSTSTFLIEFFARIAAGPPIEVVGKVASRVCNLTICQKARVGGGAMTGAVLVKGGAVLIVEECDISSEVGHCVVVQGAGSCGYVLHNAERTLLPHREGWRANATIVDEHGGAQPDVAVRCIFRLPSGSWLASVRACSRVIPDGAPARRTARCSSSLPLSASTETSARADAPATILNIGSVAGSCAYPGGNCYGGTKAFGAVRFSLPMDAGLS